MTKLTALFLICLTSTPVLTSEPMSFSINTKKWSHVLDDHFISITVNPTDLLQGKVYGLTMNSTMSILKGLAPAYVRIGSADTAKYTFKRNRYPSDMIKPEDEYTVTEAHWMAFNEVAQSAGLDVIVCLNAAHRIEGTKKWDTRNSLELISFSDSQGYNLTWQLGYEIQSGEDLSGLQFGKDLNRLRTILNAFPRYQHSKLIGPDVRVVHKKEDIDFWNDVLVEAGPTLDAVTWHPRWPQPSKMKVSDNSYLGYEFPIDYLEWDKAQLNKILQKSIFKNPVWIGETKRESTGTFAEGLIWARRLVLAAKLGVEVVMKQPNLMDVSHPKPEYWIALLHKRLLGKSVLETRSATNNSDISVASHCTNPHYWIDKPEKLQDGAVSVYGVNMGGFEQKIQIKGTWSGKSQLLFQYVLTSGSDPDSVFSQMTYLNGEPLMMTDDGLLPDIIPKIKKLEKGLTMKLPPYSVGFWVIPEARVKICQIQPHSIATINIETLTPSVKTAPKNLENIRDINSFLVEKLMNPESESEEIHEPKIETDSSESSEKSIPLLTKENTLPRVARRIRQVKPLDELNQELKTIMKETEEFLTKPETITNLNSKLKLPKTTKSMERRIQTIAEGISDAIKTTNQEHEFNKFLEDSGLKKDFGSLLINDKRLSGSGIDYEPYYGAQNLRNGISQRLRRSISQSDEFLEERSFEEKEKQSFEPKFKNKISLAHDESEDNKNWRQELVIPHQPDLKGLEERYKAIVHSKIQDGKRKIDDIKRKIKQDEVEIGHKIKQPETVNDIQEEIIKKEIELLEKTEETVADILKSQKKRQETFEDIIFDELNDVKGERITALKEMHRNQKKKENSIVKRQTQTPLSRPFLKTVEYIEKNFNLEPESVRKIKRSLEEKMGEILRNYDTKKSLETKKNVVNPKEDKKIASKRHLKEEEKKKEERQFIKTTENVLKHKDQIKEKNGAVKGLTKSSKSHHRTRPSKKTDSVKNESVQISKKKEENKQKQQENEEEDSFELFNEKKASAPLKRSERRRSIEHPEEKTRFVMKEFKSVQKEEHSKANKIDHEVKEKQEEEKEEKEKKEESAKVEISEDVMTGKKEKILEPTPLKNDKERRENMLKQITSMVDHMNSMERNGERSKRMGEDEEISEEFETDIRSRKIKRRPRKAEINETPPEALEKPVEKTVEEIITVAPQITTATTPVNKPSKLRKHRNRQNRRQKEKKTIVEATTQQATKQQEEAEPKKKRHLTGIDRSLLELDKKKLFKPKPKKILPKLFRHGNELLLGHKEKETEVPLVLPTSNHVTTIPQPNLPSVETKEELLKDLEEIVEEKLFLEQDSKTSKEGLEKNGEEFSEKIKIKETDFSGETPTPTEGYIIVEPTEINEKSSLEDAIEENMSTPKFNDLIEEKKQTEEKIKEHLPEVILSNEQLQDTSTATLETKKDESLTNEEVIDGEKEAPILKISIEEETLSSATAIPVEKKINYLSARTPGKSVNKEEIMPPVPLIEEDYDSALKSLDIDNSKRKRRATFVPNHGEEDEDEDYSSEERIQKFKQMVYKKSPAKKLLKNEVRPSSGMGIRADEFLRMAGSTVRVMFDDVIPEAYGQTKTKIQNMGIPEYIKEFGKIVQQMKNLDQIFLNIGEAAVKGYIKGNKAEKGPYIQVISRKKRNAKELRDISLEEGTIPSPLIDNSEIITAKDTTKSTSLMELTPEIAETQRSNLHAKTTEGRTRNVEYATTTTKQAIFADKRRNHWSDYKNGNEPGQSVHQILDRETLDPYNAWNSQSTEETPPSEKAQTPQSLVEKNFKFEITQTNNPISNSENPINLKIFQNQIPKADEPLQDEIKKNDQTDSIATSNEMSSKTYPLTEDLKNKISPWIKTTKDFINQAITTLQRQKELSEIFARESINDFMNKEITKKIVGKRDVSNEEPQLPVYHMAPTGQKKRETTQKYSNESLIRHLRELQPGVYVVPTEEMTNIRSEQITNEAKQKSGMPNVVTLNIYYDKKSPNGKVEASSQTGEPMANQDVVTYYQNKAWNAAASQYDQNNQYVSSMAVQDFGNSLVTPLQVNPINPIIQNSPVYATEPRVAELPNSRLIQYPSTSYHYPPVAKIYPPVVPNPQSVYSPLYYLPSENRLISQSPGTKRQWREFKARTGAVPIGSNSGWNIQFEPVPGTVRSSLKPLATGSYNKNFKLYSDKKRSVGDFKMSPTWSETALPFWKFFSTSSSENKGEKPILEESKEKQETTDSESLEVFVENRKRAKGSDEKKTKSNHTENGTEEEVVEKKEEEVEEEDQKEEENEKSRKRRSVKENNILLPKTRKLNKRSYPYEVEFKDHDILPEWFGTYQEIDNSLDHLPPHIRRSHIVSTPWSDEDEELLGILDADDELALLDMDNDYYYSNDNSINHLRRYPRSTDQFDSNSIKSNMIYKMPMDINHVKPKILGMSGIKKLTDEDSSLELATKVKSTENKTPTTMSSISSAHSNSQQSKQQPAMISPSSLPTQQHQLLPNNQTQPSQNGTATPSRNPHDDTFYYFFKYAYDSLVKVMKSMTELF